MRRLKTGVAQLRENSDRGVALIVALCASVLIIGLSMGLVHSASLVLSTANQKLVQERSYQLAQSMSQTLEAELLSGSGEFFIYANGFIEKPKYKTYDPDKAAETTYYLEAAGTNPDYGDFMLHLRKEKVHGDSPTSYHGDFPYDVGDTVKQQVAEIKNRTFIARELHVDVESLSGETGYLYPAAYYRKDSYRPKFIWRSTKAQYDGVPVYYDAANKKWRLVSNKQEIKPQQGETVTIEWSYTTKIVDKTFVPIYLEDRP